VLGWSAKKCPYCGNEKHNMDTWGIATDGAEIDKIKRKKGKNVYRINGILGWYVDEEQIYTSVEAAIAECDRRNIRLKERKGGRA
jgi:hypothetical protein